MEQKKTFNIATEIQNKELIIYTKNHCAILIHTQRFNAQYSSILLNLLSMLQSWQMQVVYKSEHETAKLFSDTILSEQFL